MDQPPQQEDDRINLPMRRVRMGQYELTVGDYHFEMYSDYVDRKGAYDKMRTYKEWYGSINGDVVVSGNDTKTIKAFLKPIVDKAHEAIRLDRRREQGRHLLLELFKVADHADLPDNVRQAYDEYGSDALLDLDKWIRELTNAPVEVDSEETDEPEEPEEVDEEKKSDEEDTSGSDDETIVRSL